jgi:hypothetical protein
MKQPATEALNASSTPETTLDLDALARDIERVIVTKLPEEDFVGNTHYLEIDGQGIGGAAVSGWLRQEGDTVIEAIDIDGADLNEAYLHSAYAKLLGTLTAGNPKVTEINGVFDNVLTAVVLDLDTYGHISDGWEVKYYATMNGVVEELSYPFEVYDHIAAQDLVTHILTKVPELPE